MIHANLKSQNIYLLCITSYRKKYWNHFFFQLNTHFFQDFHIGVVYACVMSIVYNRGHFPSAASTRARVYSKNISIQDIRF